MRVTNVVRMTELAHARRKLDEDGNPMIGRRYWYRSDLEEQKPITMPQLPKSRFIWDKNQRIVGMADGSVFISI